MPTTNDTSSRLHAEKTARQLESELLFAFPQAKVESNPSSAVDLWHTVEQEKNKKSHLIWDVNQGLVYVFMFANEDKLPSIAITLRPVQPPHPTDLKLANAYARIFNEDVKATPILLRHQENWETLEIFRVPRAIARLTAFSTTPFLRWLTNMDAAAHLRYEGDPLQSIVLMSKQVKWISKPVEVGYVPFKHPLTFSQALLEEKWIRAITRSSEVGLFGLGHSGNIIGVIAIPQNVVHTANELVLPTELQSITSLVRPGTMAFIAASNGDLYVVLPNGAVFVKSQGRWHYLNFASFQSLLSKHVPDAITRPLLQLMLDLSYDRHGALFCIPTDLSAIGKLVPDHEFQQRPNYTLRSAISGLRIDSDAHQKIILAAAGIDGGIVVSRAGLVVDVACIIGEPDADTLTAAGHLQLKRFPGARSTAAWNASIFGLGIKVSEDGPISVFSNGQLVGQLG